jgi:hypothetical protein
MAALIAGWTAILHHQGKPLPTRRGSKADSERERTHPDPPLLSGMGGQSFHSGMGEVGPEGERTAMSALWSSPAAAGDEVCRSAAGAVDHVVDFAAPKG